MTEIYRKIKLDLSRRSANRVVFSRQNDVGSRILIIDLTDDGEPYKIESGNAVSLIFKRADGVSGAIAASVLEDGCVFVELAQTMLGCAGEVACSISLFDASGNRLSSSDFYIDVLESYYSGEALSSDPEYDLLHSLFTKISAYQSKEEERVSGENARIGAEEERILAERERAESEEERERARSEFEGEVSARIDAQDERLSGRIGNSGRAILSSASWKTDNTQTVVVSGLGEDDLVIFYPATSLDRDIIGVHGVFISPNPTKNRFSVRAEFIPSADISLDYYIIRGRLPEKGDS